MRWLPVLRWRGTSQNPMAKADEQFNVQQPLRAAPSIIVHSQPCASNAGIFHGCDAFPAAGPMPSAGERDRLVAELVARMGNKDEAALGQLYDMTVKRLYKFALRIVRDPGLAQEVTEDALFQAWREASRFDVNRGKVIT